MATKFNRGEVLAYFLTWTTYGTWLPGDERGWCAGDELEMPGGNPFLVEINRSRMKEPIFVMSGPHRWVVEKTIRRHCEVRGWYRHAVNVRTNHVHVVVTAARYRPDVVRDQFKSWCTRELKQMETTRTRFWTEGGSCRWINHEDDLEAAVFYVSQAQDRKGAEGGVRE